MKTFAIIPARGGSKGVPEKNIIVIANKPLIVWSIETALSSSLVDKVFVTTDDKRIADISRKYGAEIINRPKELANDNSTSESALLHVLNVIEKQHNIIPEEIVLLQATSPIRESVDIDKAIKVFNDGKLDSLFSCCKVKDRFIWQKDRGVYKSVNYDFTNRQRRQDIEEKYLENGSIYIFKPEILRTYNNRLGGKIGIYEMPFWKSFQIDIPEDIEICEYYLKKLYGVKNE